MTRLTCTLVALGSTAAFASGFSFHKSGSEDGEAWVLVHDEDSATMSGSMLDLRRARKQLRKVQGDFLWFRKDRKEYVVEDKQIIGRILDATKPQTELGKRQSDLGGQQSELGRRQAELGREQAAIAARQARAAVREAHATDDDRIERETRRTRQRELEGAQRELEREQEELAREQEELGRRQEELGRQQEELAREVEHTVAEAVDESLRNGSAREVQ
jgi:hypothetical protein